MPAYEVLAERSSRSGKHVGAISSGGLSTRPSRKAYEEVKAPFDEPRKPSASPLQAMREDAEVIKMQSYACNWSVVSHDIISNAVRSAHM